MKTKTAGAAKDASIAVNVAGTPLATPAKQPLCVPTQALADAIVSEWSTQKKFTPTGMPLTALAYTAIDKIATQQGAIIEALLAFADTDTLAYRAESGMLLDEQKKHWDPVLQWARNEFGVAWKTTSGIMPVDQEPALHEALRQHMRAIPPMQLAAVSLLASLYSSLVLALAVGAGRLTAVDGFTLSRIEEETQARQWGRDMEAEKRAARLKAEIEAAGRFLGLLEA